MAKQKRQTTVIATDGTKRVLQWDPGTMPSLEWLQKAVEGHIELVPGGKEGLYAYANEEGIMRNMDANITASEIVGFQHLCMFGKIMLLAGPVVILEGFPLEGGETLKAITPETLGE